MSAEAIHEEDPRDPETILRDLPEREHTGFLAQYREAAHAATDDVAGYKQLQWLLEMWRVRANVLAKVLEQQPDYYEEQAVQFEAARDGVEGTPIEQVIADRHGIPLADAEAIWAEKVEAGRSGR